MSKFNAKQLLWIDFETDGLDPSTLNILEVSLILTDSDLNVIDELKNLNVYKDQEVLSQLNEWCLTTHTANGVLERCKSSTLSLDDVKNKIVDFLNKHQINNTAYLAGSGVHYDLNILRHTWPSIASRFPYRILDTSSFLIAAGFWSEALVCENKKVQKGNHSSYGDLQASLAYMRNYKKFCFDQPLSLGGTIIIGD